MTVKEILTKKPFYRLTNGGTEAKNYNEPMFVDTMQYAERRMKGQQMTQADYLEEFYPFSHRVMSDFYFPEFYNYSTDMVDGKEEIKFHREETFRIGSTLQSLITCQQLVHLTGNDIHFEITDKKSDSTKDTMYKAFQTGWLRKNMEAVFYELARSVKITADGAVVYYIDNGKMGARVLSFLNGDTLFPHYDPITGKMNTFGRKFCSYDEDGKENKVYVEVWDDKYLSRYRQSVKGLKGAVNKAKDYIGLDAFELVFRREHGFSRIPIVYMRDKDNGPCWNLVQPLIDDYEVALSYFAKNNAGAALPSYVMKGDDIDIQGDPLGRVRAFTMGKDDDVSLLQPNGLSENYTKYIEYLLNEIFQGAYIVRQPELKSGDTPTGTMKLYYAPSLDKATLEAKDYKETIDQMQSLFCEGYGIEQKSITEFTRINDDIFGYIMPFVHENASSLVADLVNAKNSGILSVQSATEYCPYAANNEMDRLTKEAKQEQQADRLYQLRTMRNTFTANNSTTENNNQ